MALDLLGDLRRTHRCGELRASHAGARAVLMGWVNRRRDLGHLIFVDVRDRSGVTQVVFNKDANAALHAKAGDLRSEYVVAVIGTVKQRDAATVNRNIPTGEIELVAEELRILNESRTPPFLPGDTTLANDYAGMTEAGTTARGLYRWMYCHTVLGWRVPTLVKSGPVRSEPRSSGVWYAKSPGADGRPKTLSCGNGRTCCVWQ